MAFSPEDFERMKLGKIIWNDDPSVIAVQCIYCENAVPSYTALTSENLRIDGYDHRIYEYCDCEESKKHHPRFCTCNHCFLPGDAMC